MYQNGTGNQCTLSNINIFAWQIKRKKKKKMCVCGGGGKGMTTSFLYFALNMVNSILSCLT